MKRILLTIAIILLILGTAAAKPSTIEAGPGIAVVETEAGTVQGYVHDGVFTYHGIPYAQAERFAEPKPVDRWDGIRTALVWGDMAPQDTSREGDMFPSHWFWPYWEPHNVPTSENCLNLNIWTNGINDGKKRPVMVWFHGGGFMAGGSISDGVYDGENLARTGDVVVVSVNHRLNVLGYLDLSSYGSDFKSNVGVKDLVAALEWVRDNIVGFGGDPENVTIFGQSGGGAKVLTMMTAPSAKGLFHKAIVQSGATDTMGIYFLTSDIGKKIADATVKNLGLSASNIKDIKTIPYAKLAEAGNKALAEVRVAWEPVVDGTFLPQHPVGDGFSPIAKDIPLLIGSALTEWNSLLQFSQMATLQSDNKNTWSADEVQRRIKEKYGDKADAVTAAFKNAYPDKKEADVLFVDTMLRLPMLNAMGKKAEQNGAPVYSYVFTWETPIMGGYAMSYHCSEIPFVFNNIDLSLAATGGSKEARKLASRMSAAWASFARTGNPNAKGLPKWEPYTRDSGATMIFDTKPALTHNHDKELMQLLTE